MPIQIPPEFFNYQTAYSDNLYQKLNPTSNISNRDIKRVTSDNTIDELLNSSSYSNDQFIEILKCSVKSSNPWHASMDPYKNEILNNSSKLLKAFPVPSPKMNENCKTLRGKSVWNGEGYWCCILPSYNSDPIWWNNSNEMFLKLLLNDKSFDKDGKFFKYDKELVFKYPTTYLDGIFFKNFESYENWRENLLNLIKLRNTEQVYSTCNQRKIWCDETNKKDQWDSLFESFESGLKYDYDEFRKVDWKSYFNSFFWKCSDI